MFALFWHTGGPLPSWELAYPTCVKGKSSTQKCRLVGDMFVPRKVNTSISLSPTSNPWTPENTQLLLSDS